MTEHNYQMRCDGFVIKKLTTHIPMTEEDKRTWKLEVAAVNGIPTHYLSVREAKPYTVQTDMKTGEGRRVYND